MKLDLEKYKLSKLGFVLQEPLEYLPIYFESWNYAAKGVAQMYLDGNTRETIEQLPLLNIDQLKSYFSDPEDYHKALRLAHVQLTTLISAYIWCHGEKEVPRKLPANLAIPFYNVCTKLSIKPGIAGHVSFALANYKLKDKAQMIRVENMDMLYSKFIPDYGNDWFFLLTTQIELDFADGLPALLDTITASKQDDNVLLETSLRNLGTVILKMDLTLSRMSENLDPDVFFFGFRPFLAGTTSGMYGKWGGIIFEGIDNNSPQKMIGGSAAQSSTLQCLDACLNIKHKELTARYLTDIRDYLLPEHSQFIDFIETNSEVRQYVQNSGSESLTEAYNKCVLNLVHFRNRHIQTVAKFIVCPQFKERSKLMEHKYNTLNDIGTGGTGIMPFLKSLRDTTNDHMIL